MILRADDKIRQAVFSTEESTLAFLIPDWLKEAIQTGNIIIIPSEEFSDLDLAIREHLQVIH